MSLLILLEIRTVLQSDALRVTGELNKAKQTNRTNLFSRSALYTSASKPRGRLSEGVRSTFRETGVHSIEVTLKIDRTNAVRVSSTAETGQYNRIWFNTT